ncbi:hypothetical protein VNO78_24032 [Psophocarpus tetragonolobus]|uniref:Uncharacterized protein n=1 Tax=Psophocarpus tetragonolobus TaxID=3891 RepID=A0AAN9S597_PSOTE
MSSTFKKLHFTVFTYIYNYQFVVLWASDHKLFLALSDKIAAWFGRWCCALRGDYSAGMLYIMYMEKGVVLDVLIYGLMGGDNLRILILA